MKYMIVSLDGQEQIKRFNVPSFNKYKSLGYLITDINLSLHQARTIVP